MNLQKALGLSIIIALLIILAPGCTKKPGQEIDIRGEITNIAEGSQEKKVILIEGSLEEDTKFDKASVTINSKTKVYEKKEMNLKR